MTRMLLGLGLLLIGATVDAQKLRIRQIPAPPSDVSIAWAQQTLSGTVPGRNGYLEINYDPISSRTILFGILATSTSIYSTNWQFYNSSSPSFEDIGGTDSLDNTAACATTWTGTWPPARHPVGQMAIDTTRNRLWLYGGVCGGVDKSDLYYLSLGVTPSTDTFTQVTAATTPNAKNSGAIVYSADDDVLFMLGSDGGPQTHDNWVYCPSSGSLTSAQTAAGCASANDWTEVAVVGGTQPAGIAFPRLVAIGSHQVVMYGGSTGGSVVQNQTWLYTISTKTWTQKCAGGCSAPPLYTGPASPPTFAAVYVPSQGKVLYHQTHGTGAPQDWIYDPVGDTWTPVSSTGSGPVYDAVAAWDSGNGLIVAHTRDAVSGGLAIWHGVVSF